MLPLRPSAEAAVPGRSSSSSCCGSKGTAALTLPCLLIAWGSSMAAVAATLTLPCLLSARGSSMAAVATDLTLPCLLIAWDSSSLTAAAAGTSLLLPEPPSACCTAAGAALELPCLASEGCCSMLAGASSMGAVAGRALELPCLTICCVAAMGADGS